jgi:hypothetical protein
MIAPSGGFRFELFDGTDMHCDCRKDASSITIERGLIPDFPFNGLEYAETYRGEWQFSEGLSSAILIQAIAGTPFYDGRLPWPYVTFPEMGESLIKTEFPDLISITGVIAPSSVCPSSTAANHELIPFKPHFIFDPSLGSIKLSKKSASNLRKGHRVWRAADANSIEGWEAFAGIYREFTSEHNLTGGFYDFGDDHFSRLSGIRSIELFGVRSSAAWGAMACGARHGKELHLMHIRITAQGYRSFASYVLMDEVTRYCEATGLTLFLGSLRHGADEGLLRFKQRGTNKTLPAWLLTIVVRPAIYDRLAIPENQFFPGYRLP